MRRPSLADIAPEWAALAETATVAAALAEVEDTVVVYRATLPLLVHQAMDQVPSVAQTTEAHLMEAHPTEALPTTEASLPEPFSQDAQLVITMFPRRTLTLLL